MSAFGNLAGGAAEHGTDLQNTLDGVAYLISEARHPKHPTAQRQAAAAQALVELGQAKAHWEYAQGQREFYRFDKVADGPLSWSAVGAAIEAAIEDMTAVATRR